MIYKNIFAFVLLFSLVLGGTHKAFSVKPNMDHAILQSTLQRLGYFDDYVTGILNKASDKNVILFLKDHNRVTGNKLALKANIYAYEQITQAAISCILPLSGNAIEREKHSNYCYKLAKIQKRNNLEKIMLEHQDITKKVISALSKCDKKLIINPSQPTKSHWKAMQLAAKSNRLMNWPASYQNISLLLLHMANSKPYCNAFKRLLPKSNNIIDRETFFYRMYHVFGGRAKQKELGTGKLTPEVKQLMLK